MTSDLPILILAAGQSSRMRGKDKLAELVDGAPLLSARARMALAVSKNVFVALPAPDHPRRDLLSGLPVTILTAFDAAKGLGGTLRSSIPQLPDTPDFMVLLADLPELTAEDLLAVIAAHHSHPDFKIWRGCAVDGAPGHPIIFDATLRPKFAQLEGDSGADSIIRLHRAHVFHVPLPKDHARLDLDTPEDWAAWRARTGR